MFKILDQILHKKSKPELSNEDSVEYNTYMIQRWASMHSTSMAKLTNETVNYVWRGIDNDDMAYKLLMTVYPKVPYGRIPYIKKAKEEKRNVDIRDIIEFLAKEYELSHREVESYISEYKIDIKKLAKALRG